VFIETVFFFYMFIKNYEENGYETFLLYSEINEKLVEIQGKLHKKEKYDLQLEDYKRE